MGDIDGQRLAFRKRLADAVIAPFAVHRWRSLRARSYWVSLEGWQDSIAGPLSSIANHGTCEYVYARDDELFSGIDRPQALRQRLLLWHGGLADAVERFKPTTPSQVVDLAFLRRLVLDIRELIERGCDIEQARWDAAGRAGR
ncbi:hypothetical protein WMF27_39095 [Sorangium sp. So ce281]|uniref:hypothetical protein n=1 Tax=Sorangium sp. So ce281 TaxID=3133293 RepID=UPI003F60EB06